MSRARRSVRRAARFAAAGGLLCGSLMVTSALADEPARRPAVGPDRTGADLVERLGPSRTAGTWIGADGRPVVAVTDAEAGAEAVRAGARAKTVRHSMVRLRSAVDGLRAAPRVPGTAWAMDYAGNRVLVQADSTVSAADWSSLSRRAEQSGGVVHMERISGVLSARVNGAEPVFSSGGRCSAGFHVTDGRREFILTAGHCGPVGTAWSQDAGGSRPVGRTVAGRFPGGDFSLVDLSLAAGAGAGSPANGTVVNVGGGRGIQITGAGEPVVGQEVFRSGATTGLRTGRVTALNATVNYPEGTVTGLIRTTVCAEPGDSGGPLFAEGMALGVTSGGTGDCTDGGTTYFQPVTTAMEALGVRLAVPDGAPGGGGVAAAPSPGPGSGPRDTLPGAAGPVGAADGRGPGFLPFATPRSLVPGLSVIAASLALLVVGRALRSARDRRSYRRRYARAWG
ncbi:S1 family peptidase [Streptomyces sp. MUM 203J]|uniref:S1 family peptidase n=1 Tax=Streptomyces sp. MUM 203J TaxID=2791990 RepID=UPI001F038EC9|nr:S1 family peptidase [Streptomyces sp. MUM 203J]MCH0541596.1 S1 family peptidase [Streptomyces sp. MUM 203J]